jgi:ribosome recycling factor
MERDQHQFSPELQMMRDEEREKFLKALKEGAPWGQLYSIRNTIRKLNKLIEESDKEKAEKQQSAPVQSKRSEEPGPRD